MKSIFLILYLFGVVFLSGCATPKSQAGQVYDALVRNRPVWVSGTNSSNFPYSNTYPITQKSEHYKVVNAGYWVSGPGGVGNLGYEFTLSILTPFPKVVYTRATLENPNDSDKPIVYDGVLTGSERSTNVKYGPLFNVMLGKIYTLKLEVFSDPQRLELVEVINQKIEAGISERRGCIGLSSELEEYLFKTLKYAQPSSKDVIACQLIK
jgi:hypothetical protein